MVIGAREQAMRREGYALIAPLTAFLLALLGFPLLVDLVYSVSTVSFETIRSPQPTGLANFAAALADRYFWSAAWFSLRFGLLASLIEMAAGLGLAIFLAPLLSKRPWLIAFLMMPMMVAPALVGLMYRLILHEFVGVVPYYLTLWFGDFPAFLNSANAFKTLVAVESLQWTPFALLILHSSYAAIPLDVREAAALDGASAFNQLICVDLPLMAPAIAVTFFIRFIDSFRVFVWSHKHHRYEIRRAQGRCRVESVALDGSPLMDTTLGQPIRRPSKTPGPVSCSSMIAVTAIAITPTSF